MELIAKARAAGEAIDADVLVQAIPYCRHLGVIARLEGELLTLELPFAAHLVGNPMLQALHGGVIGSLLEMAAMAQVIYEVRTPNRAVVSSMSTRRCGRRTNQSRLPPCAATCCWIPSGAELRASVRQASHGQPQ
jgi:acyl-coenzyme A thioesterase PaaI-like protein